ncbi:MAG: thioredoxin [Acidobacteriota bacterium]
MSDLVEATDATFQAKVLDAGRPVLADFSATWCGPCKKLQPIVEDLAGEYAGRVDMVHIDVDQAQETAARYGVMSVPTLLFFKGGEARDQLTGFVPKETVRQHLDRLLS